MHITRRSFLIHGAQVAAGFSYASGLRPFQAQASSRTTNARERCLVVVQLTGGNDGLNCLVPLRQDGYFRARPSLALPPGELVRLDDDHGLHPALSSWRELYERGTLAIVRGVGLPEPNRSHFESMDSWHTAECKVPGTPASKRFTGWLGRLADRCTADEAGGLRSLVAMNVGGGMLPLSLRSERALIPSVDDPRSLGLAACTQHLARARTELLERGEARGELAYLRETAKASYSLAERMLESAQSKPHVAYPDSALARRLQWIARWIESGLGARIFHVELGGFDTHARQVHAHRLLLEQLGPAMDAFQRDLRAAGVEQSVLSLVFSEFGRRVQENGSRGTDHGWAGPVFLLGPGVRPGLLGPALDLEHLVDGDLAARIDFRQCYAALERDWMHSPSGDAWPALELVQPS